MTGKDLRGQLTEPEVSELILSTVSRLCRDQAANSSQQSLSSLRVVVGTLSLIIDPLAGSLGSPPPLE